MAASVDQLRETLKPFGQEHLLAHWDQLSEASRESLAQQIAAIDFAELRSLSGAGESEEHIDWRAISERAEPPTAITLEDTSPIVEPDDARKAGEEALRAGRVGVVLVAGGQATRLGYGHPKGLFPIGPISEATLFQIFFESLVAARKRYDAAIPMMVMTSPATHGETVTFLNEQKAFGLPMEDLTVFCQGTMPAVDAESGKVLLAAPDRIATSPDGHGGVLKALAKSGLFDQMRARGIDLIFYLQVDNPLVRFCCPVFLGDHLLTNSQVSTKVIRKEWPTEKLGNLANVDGRLSVIEYSDLPEDLADRRDENGKPIFWAGNLAIHVFDRDFLASLAEGEHQLPFHRAHKKVPYVNEAGEEVSPEKPNATKFERFIFDVLPAAERAIVVETTREDEYAAVKNASGDSSPQSVREQMARQHRRWLRAAGAEVADDVVVEISPLYALDEIQTCERCQAGTKFTEQTYLR